jgi:hypothetical protein
MKKTVDGINGPVEVNDPLRSAAKPGLDLYRSNLGKSVFLPMRTNPAAQVRLIDFLCGMTAPSVVLRKFALLEVITELEQRSGHRTSLVGHRR